jgi:hypothetical protein
MPADCGIELIAPHRGNRVNLTQDGPSDDTNGVGALNGCTPGSRTSVALSHAMSGAPATSPGFFTSHARSSFFVHL